MLGEFVILWRGGAILPCGYTARQKAGQFSPGSLTTFRQATLAAARRRWRLMVAAASGRSRRVWKSRTAPRSVPGWVKMNMGRSLKAPIQYTHGPGLATPKR
jgi:hypothetical protein